MANGLEGEGVADTAPTERRGAAPFSVACGGERGPRVFLPLTTYQRNDGAISQSWPSILECRAPVRCRIMKGFETGRRQLIVSGHSSSYMCYRTQNNFFRSIFCCSRCSRELTCSHVYRLGSLGAKTPQQM